MEKKIEQIASERGYVVTEEGVLLNPKGLVVGYKNLLNYIFATIRINKTSKKFKAHRLQAYQKYGDLLFESGIMVRHLDGNPSNNSWDNILIGTNSDNQMDIPEQIRIKRARYASSYLKKYDNNKIIEYYNQVKSYKKTMEMFNIPSKGTLHYILNN